MTFLGELNLLSRFNECSVQSSVIGGNTSLDMDGIESPYTNVQWIRYDDAEIDVTTSQRHILRKSESSKKTLKASLFVSNLLSSDDGFYICRLNRPDSKEEYLLYLHVDCGKYILEGISI